MKYEKKIRVQYYETDAMGIVHHSNYIRYFETARTEFLRDSGCPYNDIEKSGIYMPVLSVYAKYKTPAVYDEEIIIVCWITKIKGASMELNYEVRSAEDDTIHVTGVSTHAFTDHNLRPVKLKTYAPKIYEFFKLGE